MDVSSVWTVPAVVAALIAGVAYMPVLLVSVHVRRRRGMPFLTGVNILVLTTFQTIGQAAASIYVDDPLWPRIASREFLYVPFAVSLVVALTGALWIKTRRAHR